MILEQGRPLFKVVALLSFWDEPDEWLTNLCHSLKGVASHLVALDGRYSRFPSEHNESPSSNYQALRTACSETGIELALVSGGVYEGDEVEKRSHLFQLGETVTTEDDWYLVIDGDTYIESAPEELRLEGDCADVLLKRGDQVQCEDFRAFFRAIRGLRCDGNHYTYRAGDKLLWADPHNAKDLSPSMTSGVVFQHLEGQRSEERRYQAGVYYNQRHLDQTEYGTCQLCDNAQAVLKVPDNWYWRGEQLCAKWYESCEPCAQRTAGGVTGKLLGLGASQEAADLVVQQLFA